MHFARNHKERSHVPFAHFHPMLTSCKPAIQYHNQDIDIGALRYRKFLSPVGFLMLNFYSHTQFPPAPTTHNH